MTPGAIVLRCDGDDRLGAGHVARCLQIALAVRRAGGDAVFAGSYSGVAERLIDAASFTVQAPTDAAAGLPRDAAAAVVDSYAITDDEVASAGGDRAVLAFRDSAGGPDIGPAVVLDYHLDATGPGLTGAAYAPIDPSFVAARRARREGRTLVVLGGSTAGRDMLDPLVTALLEAGADGVDVAGALDGPHDDRVRALGPLAGLTSHLRAAGALVCGAGVTSYEAACAGIPALLVVLADNQERVGRAFEAFTPVIDGRTAFDAPAAIARIATSGLPQVGPRLVDGLGSSRVRDALAALAGGHAPPVVQRYRPATASDAGDLLAWRNAPGTRAASRTTHEIGDAEHTEWLARTLADPNRTLLIAERDGVAMASVRLDRAGRQAEISIAVAPAHQAVGIGTQAIREVTELELAARPELDRVVASINAGNERSGVAFERAGYRRTAESGAWMHLEAVR